MVAQLTIVTLDHILAYAQGRLSGAYHVALAQAIRSGERAKAAVKAVSLPAKKIVQLANDNRPRAAKTHSPYFIALKLD